MDITSPQVPDAPRIPVSKLAGAFKNTSASYKYFWLISLLEAIKVRGDKPSNIPLKELFAGMVAHAWYPVHYFRLSFGLQDKLGESVRAIHENFPQRYPINIKTSHLWRLLYEDERVEKALFHFQKQVPFRFLTPWLGGKHSNRLIEQKALQFERECPYRLFPAFEPPYLQVNPNWWEYFLENNSVLRAFAYWHLARYLQKHNPNVPGIVNKLQRPYKRDGLSGQRKLWKLTMSQTEGLTCLYTGEVLSYDDFDLDHFLPWSFVTHDQMWNLVPAAKSVNSSKSDRLPSLEDYLSGFVQRQKLLWDSLLHFQPDSKYREDFLQVDPHMALSDMSSEHLERAYRKLFSPLIEIAERMGYPTHWRYQP
jgi:5-methylcytosine-specific restriction endonuclease McrA